MFKFQRNIALFTFFFFLLAQGLNLFVGISIIHHKQKVRAEIANRKQLISLYFAYDEWELVKKIGNKELELEGKMFDIYIVEQGKDGINVIGHFDTKEDKLNSIAKGMHKKEQQTQKQDSFFIPLYFEVPTSFVCKIFFRLEKIYLQKQVLLLTQHERLESPPPELV